MKTKYITLGLFLLATLAVASKEPQDKIKETTSIDQTKPAKEVELSKEEQDRIAKEAKAQEKIKAAQQKQNAKLEKQQEKQLKKEAKAIAKAEKQAKAQLKAEKQYIK